MVTECSNGQMGGSSKGTERMGSNMEKECSFRNLEIKKRDGGKMEREFDGSRLMNNKSWTGINSIN